MKYLYKVTCYTPYCGTDTTYWVLAAKEEDIDPEDIDIWVHEGAESFEYLATGWGDEGFETEEDKEEFYADCGYDISGPYELYEAVKEGYCGFADADY